MSQGSDDADEVSGTAVINTQSAALRALPQRLTQVDHAQREQASLTRTAQHALQSQSSTTTRNGRPPIAPVCPRMPAHVRHKAHTALHSDTTKRSTGSLSDNVSGSDADILAHESHTTGDDSEEEEEEEDEDVIAERVLQSLQEKDRLIAELTSKLNIQTREATYAKADLHNLQGVHERTACELRDAQDKVAFLQGLLDAERSRDHTLHTSAQAESVKSSSSITSSGTKAGQQTTHAYPQNTTTTSTTTTTNCSEAELKKLRAELNESKATIKLLEDELRHAQSAWERATTQSNAQHALGIKGRGREASNNTMEVSCEGTASQSSQRSELERTLAALAEARAHDTDALRHHIELLEKLLREKTAAMRASERTHSHELCELQAEIDALGIQLDAHVGSTQERRLLERDLHLAQQREQNLRQAHTTAQTQWLRELETQKALVDELHVQRRQESEQLQVIQAALQKKDAERGKLRAALTKLQEENASLVQNEITMQAEVQRLRGIVQHNEEELHKMHEECETHTKLHAQLTSELQSVQDELAKANETVVQLRQEATIQQVSHESRLSAMQAKLQHEMQGCVTSSEELEIALRRVEAQRVAAEARATQLEEECEEVRAAMRSTAVQAQRDLLEQHELAEEVTRKVNQDYAVAQDELARRGEKIEELEKALHKAQNELHTVKCKYADCMEELKRSNTTLQVTQKELQELKSGPVVTLTQSLRDAMAEQLRLTQAVQDAEAKVVLKERTVTLLKRTSGQRVRELEKVCHIVQDSVRAMEADIRSVLSLGTTTNSRKKNSSVLHREVSSEATGSEAASVAQDEYDEEDFHHDKLNEKSAQTISSPSSYSSIQRVLQTLQHQITALLQAYKEQRHTLQGKVHSIRNLVAARAKIEATLNALREQHAEEMRYHATRYRELQQQQQKHLLREKEQEEERTEAVQRAVQAALAEQQQQYSIVQKKARQKDEYDALCTQGRILGAEFVELFWLVVGRLCTWHDKLHVVQTKGIEEHNTTPVQQQATTTTITDKGVLLVKDEAALRADCDAIAKELLGCEGGWAELSAMLTPSTNSCSSSSTKTTTTAQSTPSPLLQRNAATAVTVSELMHESNADPHTNTTLPQVSNDTTALTQCMHELQRVCTSSEVKARMTHEVVQYILQHLPMSKSESVSVAERSRMSLRQVVQACLPPIASLLLAVDDH